MLLLFAVSSITTDPRDREDTRVYARILNGPLLISRSLPTLIFHFTGLVLWSYCRLALVLEKRTIWGNWSTLYARRLIPVRKTRYSAIADFAPGCTIQLCHLANHGE